MQTEHQFLQCLSLEVEKQELINRLLSRGKDSGRADDQDESIIENRINVYNQKTSPLIEYYKKQGQTLRNKRNGNVLKKLPAV